MIELKKKGVRLEHISKIYKDPKTGKDFYAVNDTSLSIEAGSVSGAPTARPDVTVSVSHASFLKWLFGISGFGEHPLARDESIPVEARQILAALFPRTPCCSGPWG